MNINYAILGILSYKSMAGYDLKKVIQDSSFMYWSGNNNQIYKALIELHEDSLVTNEIYHQESSPSKKVYTITEKGMEQLRIWSMLSPESPEIKKAFLVQFAFSGQLSDDELVKLLEQYQQEIKGKIALEKEKKRKGNFAPNRTQRERVIWELIYKNILDTHEAELEWIHQVLHAISSDSDAKGDNYGI